MADEVQICNLALSWLGQKRINSLKDNQTEAVVMDANYVLSRDKVLADHPWTFAIKRQKLTAVVGDPGFGPQNRFLIPSDVLRVFRVYRPNDASQADNFTNAYWTREGRYIYANEDVIWCHFIIRVTDPNLFSPSFVHALAARLAADTAMVFTENRQMLVDMEALYNEKMAEAAYADGSQGRTERVRSTILTGARKR
jgi:hypothetical protein